MRADGYIRVSRVGGREGPSFISPSEQRSRIHAWAKARGIELVELHEDLDQPGSKADRPGLIRAMERIERGTVEGLVVARLDRFGRSAVDNARLLDQIRAAGGTFFTVAEGIETTGAMGEFMAHIFTAFAQLELARITDNWASARARAVERGVHIASRTPTGYLRRDDGRLALGPDAPAIARLFKAKAEGASWRELAVILRQAKVRTPYGAEHWVPRSLVHLVSNRVYLGEARSGEFVHVGAHEPLVDEATWVLAQAPAGKRSEGRGGALLSGLLRCAGCRYVLKADHMRDRDGEKLRLYRCRGPRAQGRCPSPASTLGRVIEPFVIDAFFEGLGDVRAESIRAQTDLGEAQDALSAAERELIAYRDSAAAAILGADFEAGLRLRAEKVKRARDVLTRAREAAGGDLPDSETLRGVWADLTVAERRHLLSLGIDAIFLRRAPRPDTPISGRALVLWKGEGPDDLPGPGRRGDGIRGFEW